MARHAWVGMREYTPPLLCAGCRLTVQIGQLGSVKFGLRLGWATGSTSRLSTCSKVDQIHCGEVELLCAMCMPTRPTVTLRSTCLPSGPRSITTAGVV